MLQGDMRFLEEIRGVLGDVHWPVKYMSIETDRVFII